MTLDPKEKAEFQRQQLAQAEEINRLKRQIESLKHQNERLKAWIRNLEGCSQSISLSPSVGANADDTSKLHTVPGQRHSRFSSYQRIGVPPVSLPPTLTSHVDLGDVLLHSPHKNLTASITIFTVMQSSGIPTKETVDTGKLLVVDTTWCCQVQC